MSKKMTPCEKLGYKVGDKFEVIGHHAFKKGQVVTLHEDDGTECPLFAGDGGGAGVFDGVECSFATLNEQVRKIANKLKPAKQALADAIHQNGGWPNHCDCNFATSNDRHLACFFTERPVKGRFTEWSGWVRVAVLSRTAKPLPNWHQCIISRDEYFTAYPEQVKVEICNETKHKVEVEMESESEMTINVSDWYKNGELPPVGEVCEAYVGRPPKWIETEIVAHKGGFFIGWCNSLMKACQGNWVDGLRPLRTEREKEIDEMVDVITDGRDSPLYVIKIATKLYDAGYRKEVK